ncbi:MAG: polysaccharide deacetylase family protein [Acidobacteriota bacterium]
MNGLCAFVLLALLAVPIHLSGQSTFAWPEGKRVAVSLSFDDARASQVVTGLDIFAKHAAKVTLYVNPRSMEKQLDGWKRAVKDGHEIGNHSDSHPCSGNFPWSRKKALEEYSAAKWGAELDTANRAIEQMLGVKAISFAYPCGSKYIGRGESTLSTVPLVAKRFLSGRGFRDEAANDPAYCDLAQLLGVESDGMSMEQMKQAVNTAAQTGAWLVFAGHEIGPAGKQTTAAAVLDQFLAYAKDPANGIWLETVGTVARYVKDRRGSAR